MNQKIFLRFLVLCIGIAQIPFSSALGVVNGDKVDRKSVGLGGAQDYTVELNTVKKEGASSYGSSAISFCTGVLISPTAILTAGHCATAKPRAKFNGKGLDVKSVHLLSGYNKKNVYDKKSLANDLAILKLKKAAPTGSKVARLPDRNENLKQNLQLTVIGYGRTGLNLKTLDMDDMGTLRKGLNSRYEAAENGIVIDQSTGSAGLCEGDSGGPLLEENTQGFTVWGIASTVRPSTLSAEQKKDSDLLRKDIGSFLRKYNDIDLCRGTGLYTDVRSELDWIKATLAQP